MFFDTHAHYDDTAFNEDREAVLSQIKADGVDFVLIPGCDYDSSVNALRIANKHDFVYFAAGLHPENLSNVSIDWYDDIARLASHPKCLAIGEIGLDYYWDAGKKDLQKEIFAGQLSMAIDLDKPVIVHDREAHGDSLEIVRQYPGVRGVFHCFSGSLEMARELLKLGFYLGFDGPITYKNNAKSAAIIEECPLDRMLIETDSPYLSPVPMRGRRNDSSNLKYIAEKIAEIKKLSLEEIADRTTANAKNCFGIL